VLLKIIADGEIAELRRIGDPSDAWPRQLPVGIAPMSSAI